MNEAFSFAPEFKKMMKRLGLTYNSMRLYEQAFTHQTYVNETKGKKLENYQRLEFLGDSILGFLVAEYLYDNRNIPEGTMTKIRAKFVCEQANATYAKELGIDKLIQVGNGVRYNDGISDAIIGDVFESFLGAMYLDHDMEYVREFLVKHVFPHMKTDDYGYFVDYKSKLQEYIQAESRNSVNYELLSSSGPAHDRTFEVAVYHDGIMLGKGVGKTKKEAEQIAAKNALGIVAGNK